MEKNFESHAIIGIVECLNYLDNVGTTKHKEPIVTISNESNSDLSSDLLVKSDGNKITNNQESFDMENKSARYINVDLSRTSDSKMGGSN